jgi:hypothetical protein
MSYSENDILKPSPDGKPNKLIYTNNKVFNNSKCMFIEYHDVLRSPYFLFLYYMKNIEVFRKIFDFSPMGESIEENYEWYINREYFNPFMSLPIEEGFTEKSFKDDTELAIWLNEFFNGEYINTNKAFDTTRYELKFSNTLRAIINKKLLVDKFIVYSEVVDEVLYKDVRENYGKDIVIVNGDIEEVLKTVPEDTTYVFSRLTRLLDLQDCNKLNFSSVLIADRYRYNYDDEGKFIINIEDLFKTNLFKIDFFDNIGLYLKE